MAYNPASQIVSQNRSNDLYAWTGHGSGSTTSVANGLNQVTSIGGAATTHDTKGNLTGDPVTGRFQYTGQMWLPEIGVQYSKARVYAPHVGRFLQTDPTGYADGMNIYAYTAIDPVNLVDPSGLNLSANNVTCTGTRITSGCGEGGISSGSSGFSTAGVGGQYQTGSSPDFGGSGHSVCVQYCNNPPSGYDNGSGEIVVYPSPVYAYVPPAISWGPDTTPPTDVASLRRVCQELIVAFVCLIINEERPNRPVNPPKPPAPIDGGTPPPPPPPTGVRFPPTPEVPLPRQPGVRPPSLPPDN